MKQTKTTRTPRLKTFECTLQGWMRTWTFTLEATSKPAAKAAAKELARQSPDFLPGALRCTSLTELK